MAAPSRRSTESTWSSNCLRTVRASGSMARIATMRGSLLACTAAALDVGERQEHVPLYLHGIGDFLPGIGRSTVFCLVIGAQFVFLGLLAGHNLLILQPR